ncbi:MAG: acyltransferase, partial [Oceanisphaera sp.]|nr:acyltransferase [Oceanisphaera sp.]
MKDAVSYRPDIDGLRAIAVLAVVVFNGFPVLLPGGFVGVDVFFVISGFLISRIIFEKLEQGNFSFSGFYAARVRRIFPALLVVLAVCLVMGWLALLPDEFSQLGQHVLASAAFVQNVVLWQEAGYFDVATELKPLMHLWSLAVEEQFYIVYPLLIWAAWRLGWPVLPVITVLGVASFGMNLVGMSQDPAQTFFLAHTRVWELLVGAAIARFADRGWHVPMPWANLLSGAGLLLLVASGVLVHQGRAFPGAWALLPVLGAGALILAGSQAWFNRRFLVLRPVVFIGLISYPLYLWHWPLLSFARIMENGTPAVWIRVISVALSLMLAWLTWKFVETPIRFGTATRFKSPA